jgi:ornithine--oxo-acid transaminase
VEARAAGRGSADVLRPVAVIVANVMDEAHRGTGMMWDFGRTLVKQAMTR